MVLIFLCRRKGVHLNEIKPLKKELIELNDQEAVKCDINKVLPHKLNIKFL